MRDRHGGLLSAHPGRLFTIATTAYILFGIVLEERDLVDVLGEDYRRYRARVSMLIPWRKSA